MVKLIQDHVYTDGKYTYVAHKCDGNLLDWMLGRFIRDGTKIKYPSAPNEFTGFSLDTKGEWHYLLIGDPKYTDRDIFSNSYPDFDWDVAPKLQDVGANLAIYLGTP